MTPAPLVSVIIPSYNRAYCLERSVDSVLGQTYRNLELILVDDGSTDDTPDLVRRRWGSDSRVRYHRQANTGISGARNAGLARVTGDFVALLDSDDEYSPWKLELQIACMQAYPEVGMTWTDMRAVDPDNRVLDQSYLRRMYTAYRWFPTFESLFSAATPLDRLFAGAADLAPGRKFYYGDIGMQMLMGNLVQTSTVVLTRARAEEVGKFREDLRVAGEDFDYHLRTCRKGPVGYLDVSSIDYRRGLGDHATGSGNSIHLAQNFLKVIEPILTGEGERITLPSKMRNAVLAEAYAWVGEMLLDQGDAAGARRRLAQSLARQPLQARTTGLLAASLLPPQLRTMARRTYRAIKRRGGPSPRL